MTEFIEGLKELEQRTGLKVQNPDDIRLKANGVVKVVMPTRKGLDGERVPIDAERTRRRMKKLGLKVVDLANALSLTPGAVQHWLARRSDPNEEHFLALARVLKTRTNVLVGNTYSGQGKRAGKAYKGRYAKKSAKR